MIKLLGTRLLNKEPNYKEQEPKNKRQEPNSKKQEAKKIQMVCTRPCPAPHLPLYTQLLFPQAKAQRLQRLCSMPLGATRINQSTNILINPSSPIHSPVAPVLLLSFPGRAGYGKRPGCAAWRYNRAPDCRLTRYWAFLPISTPRFGH